MVQKQLSSANLEKVLTGTRATVQSVVAILKANLSGWYLLLALLLFSVLFSGCKEDEMPVSEKTLAATECTTEVTAESIMCGLGAFENIWFKKSDGTYLQPWINATELNTLTPGKKYRISYSVTEKDDRYNDVLTCQAVVPDAEIVKVTCAVEKQVD